MTDTPQAPTDQMAFGFPRLDADEKCVAAAIVEFVCTALSCSEAHKPSEACLFQFGQRVEQFIVASRTPAAIEAAAASAGDGDQPATFPPKSATGAGYFTRAELSKSEAADFSKRLAACIAQIKKIGGIK